jgi:hypothetical protein
MYKVDAYLDGKNTPTAKIEQLKMKRDWMHHSIYHCTPLSLANTFGYGVYFDQDISFTWDGDVLNPAKAILGKEIIGEDRGGGTVSFHTNLLFTTDENTSLLTMPVPNQELKHATVLTSLLSTSFFTSNIPIVWKLQKANYEYVVPAGTYVAALLPISLAVFQETEINIHLDDGLNKKQVHQQKEYLEALRIGQKEKKFKRLYERSINHLGEKIGTHEVENFDMKVNYIHKEKND